MTAPANDNLANAQVLAPGTYQVTGDTTEATQESGEFRATANGTGLSSELGLHTVWFRWTPVDGMTASVNTNGSAFDTYLTIWRAKSGVTDPATDVDDIEVVASNDDSGDGSASDVVFSASSGVTYYFQVSGFSSTDFGAYTLNYPSPGVSLFTSQTPSSANNSDGTPGITTATSLMFDVGGTVNAVRFYATTTVSGTYTGALWQVTDNDDPAPGAGTLLASKVRPTAPAAGGWNLITFDTPVSVTAGVLYRAGVHSSAGRYVTTAAFFSTALTNGDITAPQSGTDPVGLGTLRQGTFEVNASLTYPDTTFNTSNYFVDVDFTPGGSSDVNGAAALASTSSLTAAAIVIRLGTATLASTSTLVATAARLGVATLASASALTAAALTARAGVAAIASTSTLTAAATVIRLGVATPASTSSLAAVAAVVRLGVAAPASTSTLTAAVIVIRHGAAVLTSTSTLTGSTAATTNGTAAIASTSTLTAAATVVRNMSTIVDTFSAGSLDAVLWSGSYNGTAVSGGRARVPCTTGLAALKSASVYTFDSIFLQLWVPALNGATEAYVDILLRSAAQPGGTDVGFHIDMVAGTLEAKSRSGYFDPAPTSTTYSATDHRWLRLRRSAGNVLFETSPDVATWTVLRTLTTPAWLVSPADVSVTVQSYRNSGTANVAEVDNVNAAMVDPAPVGVASTSTLTASATVVRQGVASLAATSTLAAVAVTARPGAAGLASTSVMAPAAAVLVQADTPLVGASALSAAAVVVMPAGASLASISSISAMPGNVNQPGRLTVSAAAPRLVTASQASRLVSTTWP